MTKALLIEPKSSVYQQVTDALKKLDIAVEFAKTGKDAFDKALTTSPDLVILDIEMPGLDVLSLTRRIKEHSPDLPVIFLASHHGGSEVQNEAARLGAEVFQTKPFRQSEFIAHIKDIKTLKATVYPGMSIKPSPTEIPIPLSEVPSPLFGSLTAHLLPDLHDPNTGRLDARRIANYLSISVSCLAQAIGKSDAAVHKSPASISLQDSLAPIARSLAVLLRLLCSREHVLAWLNCPHPDLGGHTPMSLILTGKATAVTEMLEAVLAGQPS